MGIVNVDDDLHDQMRKASKVAFRSINAQAAWWIRIGMLCEAEPSLSFNAIVAREMRAAGVAPQPLVAPVEPVPEPETGGA
ncbi:MAG TPA: ParD-like family protein [Novosphingobium sp.]|nr:ParD-like family protein [Novosphingobium sp.]